jgi:hypothetical protein
MNRKQKKTGDITDGASEITIATFRIMTDTIFRNLTHIIMAIIHHITPTIPTILTTPTTEAMGTGILIGMVGNTIAVTHPVTIKIETFIMARDAHEVIEVSGIVVHLPIDQARKWTENQTELLQKRVLLDAGNQDDIKGGANVKDEKIGLHHPNTCRLENNLHPILNSVHHNIFFDPS